jgi:hypothetical protein
VLVVVAATPKINPKMDTVPSSMPNTTVPADLTSEARSRWNVAANAIRVSSLRRQRRPPLSMTPAQSSYQKCIVARNVGMRHCLPPSR